MASMHVVPFLQALWAPARGQLEGAVTLFLRPSNQSFHLPLEEVFEFTCEDEAELVELADGQNAYFGLGLRRLGLSTYKQGTKKDILALPGVWLDLDFFNPEFPDAHKSKDLPRSLDEAAVLIEGLPDPSVIINSGNGNQLGWFFREPILLDNQSRRTQVQKVIKTFYEPIKARAVELGWDQDITGSIQHIFRLPGFTNKKTDLPTSLLFLAEDWRYDPEELGLKMPKPRKKAEAEAEVPSPPKESPKTEPADEALIVKQLRRISPNKVHYDAVQALLKGESFANPGERDATMQKLCSVVSWLPAGRKADAKDLAELFRKSLTHWAAEGDADKSLEEELEKVVDKIERSQADYWHQYPQGQGVDEIPRERLRGIAKTFGVKLEDDPEDDEEEMSNAQIVKFSIIQFRDVYFVYHYGKEHYIPTRPFSSKELVQVCRDAWEEAPPGISIYYTNDKGEEKTKTVPRLCEEYCTVAERLISDMTIEESKFDRDKSLFRQAIALMVITEPEYNKDVDVWLRLLAGPKQEKLLDWVACVPRVKKPNSALYLEGFSGAGKGLLATGLARIWNESGTPTKFIDAIGQFNAPVMDCPFVWIDESLPARKGDITGELRALVGASSLSVNQKNEPIRPVNGAARLMICANNEDVLMSGEANYTLRDLEAISNRILHIHAREEAVQFLIETDTRGWVTEGIIARHCLWLHQNREVVEGDRFLVEGEQTEMHRRLGLQGDVNGLIYEWLVRFATNPEPIEKLYRAKNSPGQALAGLGKEKGKGYQLVLSIHDIDKKPPPPYELLVNAEGVINHWKAYMPESRPPLSQRVGHVLGQLSHRVTKIGNKGERIRYHVIRADMILEWCRQNQIGNEDRIAANLGLELDDDEAQELDQYEREPA